MLRKNYYPILTQPSRFVAYVCLSSHIVTPVVP